MCLSWQHSAPLHASTTRPLPSCASGCVFPRTAHLQASACARRTHYHQSVPFPPSYESLCTYTCSAFAPPPPAPAHLPLAEILPDTLVLHTPSLVKVCLSPTHALPACPRHAHSPIHLPRLGHLPGQSPHVGSRCNHAVSPCAGQELPIGRCSLASVTFMSAAGPHAHPAIHDTSLDLCKCMDPCCEPVGSHLKQVDSFSQSAGTHTHCQPLPPIHPPTHPPTYPKAK